MLSSQSFHLILYHEFHWRKNPEHESRSLGTRPSLSTCSGHVKPWKYKQLENNFRRGSTLNPSLHLQLFSLSRCHTTAFGCYLLHECYFKSKLSQIGNSPWQVLSDSFTNHLSDSYKEFTFQSRWPRQCLIASNNPLTLLRKEKIL